VKGPHTHIHKVRGGAGRGGGGRRAHLRDGWAGDGRGRARGGGGADCHGEEDRHREVLVVSWTLPRKPRQGGPGYEKSQSAGKPSAQQATRQSFLPFSRLGGSAPVSVSAALSLVATSKCAPLLLSSSLSPSLLIRSFWQSCDLERHGLLLNSGESLIITVN
jgi:hypothetical protein